jgi:hypothetical protein
METEIVILLGYIVASMAIRDLLLLRSKLRTLPSKRTRRRRKAKVMR